MGVIEEEIERFLERNSGSYELVDRYSSAIYEMLEGCYVRGVKDGQEEFRESFQHHLDETKGEGYSDGYSEGYNVAKREVDLDTYKTGYLRGFDDASNGRASKVKDEISHFGGIFVDLGDIKEDK